jgi:hypothetical protein
MLKHNFCRLVTNSCPQCFAKHSDAGGELRADYKNSIAFLEEKQQEGLFKLSLQEQ